MLKDWSQKSNLKSEKVNYTSDISVDSDFGIPGAITIVNKHQKEFYLESITLEGFACGPVHFPCNSWVQSANDHPNPRIFFSNQVISYLLLVGSISFMVFDLLFVIGKRVKVKGLNLESQILILV